MLWRQEFCGPVGQGATTNGRLDACRASRSVLGVKRRLEQNVCHRPASGLVCLFQYLMERGEIDDL